MIFFLNYSKNRQIMNINSLKLSFKTKKSEKKKFKFLQELHFDKVVVSICLPLHRTSQTKFQSVSVIKG